MSVVEYLVNSLLGICVVFFALALLIAIIVIMSKFDLSDEPKKAKGAARYVDIMPQDGMSPCWCEKCQKTFNTTNFTLSSGYATELIWSNTVAVAKAVTDAGLDGGVSQMAYGTYRNIPSVNIPENVKAVLAVGGPWACSQRLWPWSWPFRPSLPGSRSADTNRRTKPS